MKMGKANSIVQEIDGNSMLNMQNINKKHNSDINNGFQSRLRQPTIKEKQTNYFNDNTNHQNVQL